MSKKRKARDHRINDDFAISYFGSILGECMTWASGPVWSHDSLIPSSDGRGVPYAAQIETKPGKMPEAWINPDLPPDIMLRLIGYCALNGLKWEC